MMEIQDDIDREIYEVGCHIIDDPYFQRARSQVHHKKTTLYSHIMGVTREAVKICDRLEKKGIRPDRKLVILGALCHDLGMIDREKKYKNDLLAWFSHAEESLYMLQEHFPETDPKVCRIIRRHMWPFTLAFPRSAEAWIVIAADKKSSFADLAGKRYDS